MKMGSARQRAYSHLRQRIIQLDAPPGTALAENEIAAALGMSRTPVREAFLVLVEEGLIKVRPQIGTFVAPMDRQNITHAQFLREAVELTSLRSLEAPLNEGVLRSLHSILDEQAECIESPDRFLELDDEFHAGLMDLAGHRPTWTTVAAAKVHLDRARRLGVGDITTAQDRLAEHRAVLGAVIADEIDQAVALLRNHLRVVLDEIRAIERQSPHLFVDRSDLHPIGPSDPVSK